MGDLALSRNRRFRQGYFYPKNTEKFKGRQPYAIYRSGLELSYFKILDENPNVLQWGSEEIVVPYFFHGAWHKYYIDLFVIFKNGDNLRKFFVELKPAAQTREPVWKPRRRKSSFLYECNEWEKNKAKWKSADAFAKSNGFEFHILTENDLKSRKK